MGVAHRDVTSRTVLAFWIAVGRTGVLAADAGSTRPTVIGRQDCELAVPYATSDR
jgi:hypothetical protein